MKDIFSFADELGPTRIIHVHDASIGLRAVLVVDNVAVGPAIGGLRMAPDVSTEECVRLARAMTFKNAAAGLAHGGGKVVLYGDPRMPREGKERLIRGLACALGDVRDYIFGPDMGTDETCMAWIKDEIGRSVGLPRELGGIPLDQIGATGWGVAHAAEVAVPYCNFELAGARMVIQGYGAVGRHAAHFLAQKGAIVVGVADSGGTLVDPAGIDLALLDDLKTKGKSVIDYPRGEKAGRDAVVDVECEIWIPAARPDVVREDNVARLKTRLVIEGANIPFTRAAEEYLHQKGVLCVPDFIANAGGVICAAVEYAGGSQAMALDAIATKVRENTRAVLEAAAEHGQLPREAAIELATARVTKAMSLRRWGAF
ncbi:Glutamate dehydrogenase [Paraburkholderia sacchari]|uniref:Glu/Leu/Phe/Val family dehydrogenase n=1 Tax=Paraburkholderia sacchari TaxID=159450 RepID=UPI0039A6DC9E